MEQLANRVASKIAKELSYPDEQKRVIAYGLIAIFQSLLMTTIVLLIGFILNTFIESAIMCFAVSILRKYSGGSHACSIASCTIIGIIFCTVFALISKMLGTVLTSPIFLLITGILIFGFALIIAILKAPVDSPNKPIRSVQKKKKMKNFTLIILIIYFVISMILLLNFNRSPAFISAFISLLFSVAWQMSSLTIPGKTILGGLDRLIYRVITFERRT